MLKSKIAQSGCNIVLLPLILKACATLCALFMFWAIPCAAQSVVVISNNSRLEPNESDLFIVRIDPGEEVINAVSVLVNLPEDLEILGEVIVNTNDWDLSISPQMPENGLSLAVASRAGAPLCEGGCEILRFEGRFSNLGEKNLSFSKTETIGASQTDFRTVSFVNFGDLSITVGGTVIPGDFDGVEGVSDGELNSVLDAFLGLTELSESQQQNLGISDVFPGDAELNAVLDAFLGVR